MLLLVVLLNCVLIGTLHLAAQEQRISTNAARLLQLRLDADGAVRRTLRSWPASIDTLGIGTGPRRLAPGVPPHVDVERIGEYLFLIRADAREPAPSLARASARILAVPPPLPPAAPVHPAPVSAGAGVHVTATGEIRTAHAGTCATTPSVPSALTASATGVVVDPGGRIDAPAASLPAHPLHHAFNRVTDLVSGVGAADSVITAPARGVVIVNGNVTISAGIRFDGLILTSGSILIAPGADVHGAVHADGDVTIAGSMVFDPCTVRAEVVSAGLDRARPAATRSWVPSF